MRRMIIAVVISLAVVTLGAYFTITMFVDAPDEQGEQASGGQELPIVTVDESNDFENSKSGTHTIDWDSWPELPSNDSIAGSRLPLNRIANYKVITCAQLEQVGRVYPTTGISATTRLLVEMLDEGTANGETIELSSEDRWNASLVFDSMFNDEGVYCGIVQDDAG